MPAGVPPAAFVVASDRIAFASFRRERGELVVRELQSVALPAGAFAAGTLGGAVAEGGPFDAALETLLARLAAPPRRASLVLPDSWARALVVELGALPERPDLRLGVLRFRLRRLVPYRVEELRIAASPIATISGQEDPVRALALFAAESVCGSLERAFALRGVRIGQITNATLARLEALHAAGRADELIALASVEEGGFVVVFADGGEPLLWRQKAFTEELEPEERAAILGSELRLTSTFLANRLGDRQPAVVYLEVPDDKAAYWTTILSEGLERPVVRIDSTHLPLAGELPAADAGELAALAGGAAREVA